MPKKKPGRKNPRVRVRTYPIERSKQKAETESLITKSIKDSGLTREDLAAIRKQMYQEEKGRRKEARKIQEAIGKAEKGTATKKDLDILEDAEIDIRLKEQSRSKSKRDWLDSYQKMILGE